MGARTHGLVTTPRASREQLAALAAIGLIGLTLRLAWIFVIPNVPISDFLGDHVFAQEFARGEFPVGVTFQGAGYPLALGLAYRLTGSHDIIVGKFENVLLSMVTLALCAYIFWRLTPRRWLAISATALVALMPTYIAYTSVLGTETLFTCCLAAVVALQLARWDWRLRYPLMGLLIGYGVITKPYFVAYPLLAALMLWLTDKDVRQAARLLLVTGACALLVIAPITWENYVQLHRFILNTYNGSYVLFVNSNSDNTTGAWIPLSNIHISAQFREQLLQHGASYPDIASGPQYAPLDPLFMAQAQHWILTHPLQFAHLGLLRLRNTFFAGAWDVRFYAADGFTPAQVAHSIALRLLFRLADLVRWILSVAGFIFVGLGAAQAVRAVTQRARRASATLLIPSLVGGYYIAVFFMSEGQPRYAVPLLFMFAFATVYLADEGWRMLARWRRGVRPRPLSALEQETLKRPRVSAR